MGTSAKQTMTMSIMKATREAIEAPGRRQKVKGFVGGAPVSAKYVRMIGADGFAPEGSRAAGLANSLLSRRSWLLEICARPGNLLRPTFLAGKSWAPRLATLVMAGATAAMPNRALPLGAGILGGVWTLAFRVAVRFRLQLPLGAYHLFENAPGFAFTRGARVLIIGAGEEGQFLAWQLQNRLQGRAYEIVGFIDSDPRRRGMRIRSVKVYGDRRQIPELVTHLHVDLIIIAIPPRKVQAPRELLALCRATSAQVKILPGVLEWLGRSEQAPGWRDLTEDDLLDRKAYHVDARACADLASGCVIMVTGAAGSIGSELCRQLADYAPRRLVLVDINESGLYDLQIELAARHPGLATDLALCDITDRDGMAAAFARTRPQQVFHAAAYKHVPILEEQPREGVRVNVLGTQLVQSLAREAGVERFVLISSDKAVNPINVLGCTKWLAEVIVLTAPKSNMRSTVVRFGNVLGSRGSVVPVFQRQIELGGPITLTHPEMTRYFLTISEAVSLVLQAASMTRGDDLFTLEMGVPIRILDLAHRLIRRYGLRPEKDIPIHITGLRPGEKMTEELVAADEEQMRTDHASIFQICRTRPYNLAQFDQRLGALIASSRNGAGPADLREELRRCVEACRADPVSGSIPSILRPAKGVL